MEARRAQMDSLMFDKFMEWIVIVIVIVIVQAGTYPTSDLNLRRYDRCEHQPQRRLAQGGAVFWYEIYWTIAIWLSGQPFIMRLAFMVYFRENHPYGGPVHPGFLDIGSLTAT